MTFVNQRYFFMQYFSIMFFLAFLNYNIFWLIMIKNILFWDYFPFLKCKRKYFRISPKSMFCVCFCFVSHILIHQIKQREQNRRSKNKFYISCCLFCNWAPLQQSRNETLQGNVAMILHYYFLRCFFLLLILFSYPLTKMLIKVGDINGFLARY